MIRINSYISKVDSIKVRVSRKSYEVMSWEGGIKQLGGLEE